MLHDKLTCSSSIRAENYCYEDENTREVKGADEKGVEFDQFSIGLPSRTDLQILFEI